MKNPVNNTSQITKNFTFFERGIDSIHTSSSNPIMFPERFESEIEYKMIGNNI